MVRGGWKHPKDNDFIRGARWAAANAYARRIALQYESLIATGKEDEANALFDLPAPEAA